MELLAITYFSVPHILLMLLAGGLVAGLYFLFRKRSSATKKAVVMVIAVINLLQHLLKSYIWPHLEGQGFNIQNTLLNMCAFLIVTTPVILMIGSDLWKNFVAIIGTISGFGSIIAIPFWYSAPELSFTLKWDLARFYFCHTALFSSSLLSLLFGVVKIKFKNFWKMPFVYFGILIIICFNNIVCMSLGIAQMGDEIDMTRIYEMLKIRNVCFVICPPPEVPIVEKIFRALTPAVFMGDETGVPVPLLWMAIPMYLIITVLGFGIFAAIDRKGFMAVCTAAGAKAKGFASFCKNAYRKTAAVFGKKPDGTDGENPPEEGWEAPEDRSEPTADEGCADGAADPDKADEPADLADDGAEPVETDDCAEACDGSESPAAGPDKAD